MSPGLEGREVDKPEQGPNAAAGGPGGALRPRGPAWPPVGRRARITPNPKLKLLDQVREVMRLKHYSLRTEQSYCEWIKRYVKFHGMRSRQELWPAEAPREQFLSELAVKGQVAVSTQNQAFNALLFLYREVLHYDLGPVNALRAERPVRVPVVLSRQECPRLFAVLEGTMQRMAERMYGSGLRLTELLRLRVKDLDLERRQVVVRASKGDQDRVTVLPERLVQRLQAHRDRVRGLHEADRGAGWRGGRYLYPCDEQAGAGGAQSVGWVKGKESRRPKAEIRRPGSGGKGRAGRRRAEGGAEAWQRYPKGVWRAGQPTGGALELYWSCTGVFPAYIRSIPGLYPVYIPVAGAAAGGREGDQGAGLEGMVQPARDGLAELEVDAFAGGGRPSLATESEARS